MTIEHPDDQESRAKIRIQTDSDGLLRRLVLVTSPFLEALTASRNVWDLPVVIFGSGRESEVEAIQKLSFNGRTPKYINNLRDFSHSTGSASFFDILRDLFDFSYQRDSRFGSLNDRPQDSPLNREELVAISKSGRYSVHEKYVVEDALVELENDVEKLCQSSAIQISWPSQKSLFPAFVVSVWLKKPRRWPMIIESNRELLSRSQRWINYGAATLDFSELCREISGKFSASPQSVEEAYKVWQLSRGGNSEKSVATIPKQISFTNAENFIAVFSGARPDGGRKSRAVQVAAPIMFEQSGDLIGVKSTAEITDSPPVVQAGAVALKRQIDRFLADHPIMNAVPSAREMVSCISDEISRVALGDYDDGTIVSVALQFNAFQWHIDSVRENLSDATLGELTGLFATAHLFLRRFPIWRQYIGIELDDGSPVDTVAEFRIARSLLSNARDYENLLDGDAKTRVGVVLSRAPSESSPPAFIDGVVRSSDNLAAVTINKASQVAISEAKEFAKTTKGEAYKMGAKSVISFAAENAENLMKLAQARQWPWAQWAMTIVKGLIDP